jgi:hypothetical protein
MRPYGKPTGIVCYYEPPRKANSLACNTSFAWVPMWTSQTIPDLRLYTMPSRVASKIVYKS